MKKVFISLIFLWTSLGWSKAPMEGAKLSSPLPSNLWIEMSKMAQPGVVGIYLKVDFKKRRRLRRDPFYDFIEEFFGQRFEYENPMQSEEDSKPIGTGFLIDNQGHIVTNYHVIEATDNDRLKTTLKVNVFGEEQLHEVDILGRDPRGDIALLRLRKKVSNLKPLQFGNSDGLQVGEYVAAFGNPYGHTNSMTVGVVSALGRTITELNRFPFIQTDASINPGNSGGPLLNTQGYVIGVNTAIDARAQGIGFAIPVNYVKKIVDIMKSGGRIQRGYLGLGLAELHPRVARAYGIKKQGVVIAGVERGFPGEKAGLQENDVVYEFNKIPVTNVSDFINLVQDTEVGKTVPIKVLRAENDNFKEQQFSITVTDHPGNKKNSVFRKSQKLSQSKYKGEPAPYDLGFSVVDSSSGARRNFDVPIRYPFGPIVSGVTPQSPAAKGGIKPGQIVLRVNDKGVNKASDVIKNLKNGLNRIWIQTPKGEKRISIQPE